VTLLDLINRLRVLLRSGPSKSSLPNDAETQMEMALLNDAAGELFGFHDWSFLMQHDGIVWLPPKIGFSSAIAEFNSTSVTFSTLSIEDGSKLSNDAFQTKMLHEEQIYRLSDLVTNAVRIGELESAFRGGYDSFGSPIAIEGTLFANEVALPSKARSVLSVRREDGTPIRFETLSRIEDFETSFPDSSLYFSDEPQAVAVGGLIRSTSRNGGERKSGVGLAIYPPPDTEGVILHYSYTRRHEDLALAADTWPGVPDEHLNLIVWMAFYSALVSNVQSDPERAQIVFRSNQHRLEKLKSADRKDPRRRTEMRPFGSRGYGPHRFPWVETRKIPSP